jgi:branched-chain amino acid transport system substrate-binding protein
VLIVALVPGCAKKPSTIKIGVQGPITGDWAYEGEGFVKALRLAVEQVNKKGGLLGSTVELVEGDDKGDPKESALVAQKMVTSKVIGVVGSYSSGCTEPASGIYEENKIIEITPASTATRLTEKGYKFLFRVITTDDRQGIVVADTFVKKMGLKKAALIHDNTTYAKGLADWTKKYMEEAGATVVFFDAITPGEKDFTPTLTKIKGLNPDVIYFSGYYPEGGLLIKQAKELGITAQFGVGDACNNPELVTIAGLDAINGVMCSTAPLPKDLPYTEAKVFMELFKLKYGEYPGSIYTPTAYDAVQVIFEGIRRAGSTDTTKVAEAIRGITNMPGTTGNIIGFDEKGDRMGTVHAMYKINEAGEWILQQ